jgi:hypothetical protein
MYGVKFNLRITLDQCYRCVIRRHCTSTLFNEKEINWLFLPCPLSLWPLILGGVAASSSAHWPRVGAAGTLALVSHFCMPRLRDISKSVGRTRECCVAHGVKSPQFTCYSHEAIAPYLTSRLFGFSQAGYPFFCDLEKAAIFGLGATRALCRCPLD